MDEEQALRLYDMGMDYITGENGMAEDAVKAVECFMQAAEMGHPDSQFSLAICYRDGSGVEQDYGKAMDWLAEAGGQGHSHAGTIAAEIMLSGDIGEPDYDNAVTILEIAADDDDPDAAFDLAELYGDFEGPMCDFEKAAYWLTILSKYDPDEERREKFVALLATCHNEGYYGDPATLLYEYSYGVNGREKDEEQAAYWAKKGALAGDLGMMTVLANMHLLGKGVPADISRGVSLYHSAAEDGAPGAQLDLAGLYFEGYGVEKNLAAAKSWCERALAQGEQGAADLLARINNEIGQSGGPAGFTLDPNSGLYYMVTPGADPATGAPGRWTTWFYPESGDYRQQFYPD